LVDGVEIWPLLAVDLDIDEARVHQRRDRRVLEALMRHDVAPVAGGVADREEDRPVERGGGAERLLAPALPMHRVVAVLEEVGARLLAEAIAVQIHEATSAAGADCAGGRGIIGSARRAATGCRRQTAAAA